MSDTLKSYEEQKAMRGEAVDTCKTCRHKLEPGDEMLVAECHCDACQNFSLHEPIADTCQYCWGRGCQFCGKPEVAHLKNNMELELSEDPDEIEREAPETYKPNAYQLGVPVHEQETIYTGSNDSDCPTLFPPKTGEYEDYYDDGIHQVSIEGIKDSGTRTEFETGAVRDARGNKGRFDLLPIMTLFRLAKHYERGCLKYGDRNWEKGIPISKYIDSAIRHLLKHVCGFTDEHHLTSALWNIAGCMETLDRIELGLLPDSLDDMPCTFADVDYERFEEILDRLL